MAAALVSRGGSATAMSPRGVLPMPKYSGVRPLAASSSAAAERTEISHRMAATRRALPPQMTSPFNRAVRPCPSGAEKSVTGERGMLFSLQ